MERSRIIGTGSFVPDRRLTNHDLERMVDTSDEWIRSRTGIKERRIVDGERPSELAAEAAIRALERAGLRGGDLDLIVVATVTPDMTFPSTACFVQERLGASRAAAFDIAAACSGFIYALDVGDRYIRSGGVRNVLVIGVDIFSRILDWSDRTTCILFGDGAGAVVMTRSGGDRGILSTHLHSDGSYWRMLYAPLNGCGEPGVKMQGNETFKVAVRMMEQVSLEALRHNHLTIEDVDLFIPHQANARIIRTTAQRLSIPMEKVYMNIERYGNTSAASIPIAIDEAFGEGRIREGSVVLLAAFGGGFTWASSLIRW